MKKKWIGFLSVCILGFSSLVGCASKDTSSVEKLTVNGQDIVLQIGDVSYTADELFGDLLNTTDGAEVAYSKILKIVVQTAMPVDTNMQAGLDLQYQTFLDDVTKYQTDNSVTYDEALKAKLSDEGVDSVEALKDLYQYQAQLGKLTTVYWEENKTAYMNEYIQERLLYYVKHILVSISSTDTSQDMFYTSISSDTAEKLYQVYDMIVNGDSFSSVAYLLPSDDSGSASTGGGYTMDLSTSFVYEFKYGLIAFDAYNQGISLDNYPSELNDLYGNGFDAIPASYFIKLDEVKDDSYLFTTSDLDTTLKTYPRNVIFNNLFNNPGVSLITYDLDIPEGEEAPANTCVVDFVKDANGNKTTARVLCDENGTPIMVTRGSSGIHFIVADTSPLDLANAQAYFSIEPDSTDGYTSYAEQEDTIIAKNDVIDELEGYARNYVQKAISGSSTVKGSEDFEQFDLFEYYLNKDYNGTTITITNSIISDLIDEYIAARRAEADAIYNDKIASQWASYIAKVKASRSEYVSKQRVPLVCLDYEDTTNENCTYTYENGFSVVDTGTGE